MIFPQTNRVAFRDGDSFVPVFADKNVPASLAEIDAIPLGILFVRCELLLGFWIAIARLLALLAKLEARLATLVGLEAALPFDCVVFAFPSVVPPVDELGSAADGFFAPLI